MEFYIVASYPYYFSWNEDLMCDHENMCKFKIIDNYLIFVNGNVMKYLYYDNNNLSFSLINKTKIILEKTEINTNFRIKINNKYIRHKNSKLFCENYDGTDLFMKDSTWIFINNIILNNDFIISRYNEDVRWTRFLQGNIIIYNKGKNNININIERNNIKIINIYNIGREGHTYLYHIINNYDNLKDKTIFLQGNPFDHSPNILELLCMVDNFTDVQSLSVYYIKNIIPSKEIID
jgi:hypothetical protein